MGFFLGRAVAPALLIGFAVGVIAGIGIMLARGRCAQAGDPFAPYLALGGVVGQLFGSDLIDWYLDISHMGRGGPPGPHDFAPKPPSPPQPPKRASLRVDTASVPVRPFSRSGHQRGPGADIPEWVFSRAKNQS